MLYGLPTATKSALAVRDRPRLDYTFIEDLREFICLRLDRVDPRQESKEYRQQQEKASILYEKLKEMLPEEGQALLLGYSEALGPRTTWRWRCSGRRLFLMGSGWS